MPNVLFTQRCVRSCPYCFAEPSAGRPTEGEFLSWENLIHLADLFQRSGERRFAILGGEPTLHPHFVDMISYLLDREFDVRVFTTGMLSDRLLSEVDATLRGVADQRFRFICNINDPAQTPVPAPQLQRVRHFLTAFGPRTIAGFNIYRPDFDLRFLFKLILEYGLVRTVRLGFAHPVPGGGNVFLSVESIDRAIERLFTFQPLFERLRIIPGFDCGFPKCRFSVERLGALNRQASEKYEFRCSPLLDIGPDLTVWSCFPLSAYQRRSVTAFETLHDVQEYYERLHEMIRSEVAGLYPECDMCPMREDKACDGGCLGHALSQFPPETLVHLKEVFK